MSAILPPVADLGLYYDFRHPHRWPEILEQIAWAETIGFTSVWISEHHFLPDGYASGTMPLAAAIAQRTTTMEIGTNVAVLPVHDPIRLAEDALTVDALSGGRARLGEHILYFANQYVDMGTFGDVPHFETPQQVADMGLITPATPEGAVEILRTTIADHPVIDTHGWTLFPGEPVDGSSARLELL